MSIPIALTAPSVLVEARIEENRTGVGVMAGLPLEAPAEVWGGEISLRTQVRLPTDESAAFELQVGDIGYCPSTGSITIYSGPTPYSTELKPVDSYLVNRIGRVMEGLEQIERVRPGTVIRIAWF